MRTLLLPGVSVLFTFLVVRVLSYRSTIGNWTVLVYASLGLLLGPTAVMILHRLVNPYSEPNFPYTPLVTSLLSLLTLAVLLLPVLGYVFRRRVHLLLSVGDAFLLGFAVGAGFDLLGLLTNVNPWESLSLLPPWQQDVQTANGPVSLAGMAYRTGCVALVVAAGLRFTRNVRVTAAAATAVALAMATGAAMTTWPVPPPEEAGFAEALRGWVSTLTAGGGLTAWVVLALVVAAQVVEGRRIDGTGDATPVAEYGLLARALKDADFRAYHRIRVIHRLRREIAIGEFERLARPDDPALTGTLPRLRTTLQAVEAGNGGRTVTIARGDIRLPWPALLALPWIFVLAMVFFPGGATRFVALALAAWSVWWYATSPERIGEFETADDVASFYGGRAILTAALAASVLTFFSSLTPPLFPRVATAFALPDARTDLDQDVFVMLIAAGAASLTASRRFRWLARPWEARRRTTVRRLWNVGTVFLIAWIGVQIYTTSIPTIHQRWGQYIAFMASVDPKVERPVEMPGWAKAIRLNQPAPFGNNLPAWLMALVASGAGLLLLWGSRRLLVVVDGNLARSATAAAPEDEVNAGG
jgi:hypothetical protein